jgi:hypothetical protein
VDGGDFDVDVDVAPNPAAAQLAPREAQAPGAGEPWPGNVLAHAEAAELLGRGLDGEIETAGTPIGAVIAALTELELAVIAGDAQAVDSGPVRRAAVTRVRVALALATAPPPGGGVDTGAVSALLAEIDALLSDVNALVPGAPAALQPSLEAIRNALVKEAIDLSEVAQRLAAGDAVSPVVPTAPRAPAAARTRVLAMGPEEKESNARGRVLALLFGAALVATATYHGLGYANRGAEYVAAPTIPGAPASAVAVTPKPITTPGGGTMTVIGSADGKPFDPEALERFTAQERAKGNVVREIGPGVYVSAPRNSAEGPAGR